ncbi:hypothetical protein F5Y14DRAFT_452736 [Nemania sp. NC0429]|nr:hypothetical protein F5Y14DRAFT_452736 [Nemania sp. NC0429]
MREQQTVLVASITMIVLTVLATGIRACDRFGTSRVSGWDDATQHGLGIHREHVSPEDYEIFLKMKIVSSISYSLGITTAEASFAVLYMRLFPIRKLVILNKVIIGYLLIRALEESLMALLHCNPISKSWIPDLKGDCIDLRPLWYSVYALNLATNFILFLQPIFVALRLQMPIVKRLELGAMFSLGFLATVMAVIRLKFVIIYGFDDTYGLSEPLIWSAAELCALIICACIPSFQRVARRVPLLNMVFRQSTRHNLGARIAQQGRSIPLQRPCHNEEVRSRPPEINNTGRFLLATQATTTVQSGTTEDSRGDSPPQRAGSTGSIMKPQEFV